MQRIVAQRGGFVVGGLFFFLLAAMVRSELAWLLAGLGVLFVLLEFRRPRVSVSPAIPLVVVGAWLMITAAMWIVSDPRQPWVWAALLAVAAAVVSIVIVAARHGARTGEDPNH